MDTNDVLTLIHRDGHIHFWDTNDLPLYPENRKIEYTNSLSDEIKNILLQISNQQQPNNKNENKQYNINMKQKIQLTESELHSLIKESVKQMLSELDWKTYANAERAAEEKGKNADNYEDQKHYYKLRNKFRKARQNAFNNEYGYDEGNHKGFYKMKVDDEPMDTYPFRAHKIVHTQARTNDRGYVGPGHRIDYGYNNYNDYAQPSFNLNDRGDEYYDKLGKAGEYAKKGNKEIENYRQGNYEYEPNGRGWHLKDDMDESIRRAIRKTLY